MIKFNFRNEKIVLDYKFYLFNEFTDIWKYDKTKTKTKANNMLYFVFLMADITEDNQLRDISPSKRAEEAKFHAFKKRDKEFTDKEYQLLSAAIQKYTYLNTTPEERMLKLFDKKIKELIEVLESTRPETVTNEENGVVSFVSNSKIITDSMTKIARVRKDREKILSVIKKEAVSQKIRGQLALSPHVRGLISLED
jgi:hypothetical protein